MRSLDKYLETRKIDYKRLEEIGFINKNNVYTLSKKILNDEFMIIINISRDKIESKLIELAFNEEYLLVDVDDAVGEYVGHVREEYEKELKNILDNCTIIEMFKTNQAKDIINYIKTKYDDELEFLWDRLPKAAVWRNKQNNKWYGIIMTINENKLGLNSEKEIEIIDLMYQKEEILNIVDNQKIFGGYHMNKKSWISLKLDNSLTNKEIFRLIDNSYNLSINKKYKV